MNTTRHNSQQDLQQPMSHLHSMIWARISDPTPDCGHPPSTEIKWLVLFTDSTIVWTSKGRMERKLITWAQEEESCTKHVVTNIEVRGYKRQQQCSTDVWRGIRQIHNSQLSRRVIMTTPTGTAQRQQKAQTQAWKNKSLSRSPHTQRLPSQGLQQPPDTCQQVWSEPPRWHAFLSQPREFRYTKPQHNQLGNCYTWKNQREPMRHQVNATERQHLQGVNALSHTKTVQQCRDFFPEGKGGCNEKRK